MSSIHEAAEDGREEELQKLIQRNIQAVNEEDEYGETPLHLACMAGHPNCVKLLLHNGAQARFTLQLPPPPPPFSSLSIQLDLQRFPFSTQLSLSSSVRTS